MDAVLLASIWEEEVSLWQIQEKTPPSWSLFQHKGNSGWGLGLWAVKQVTLAVLIVSLYRGKAMASTPYRPVGRCISRTVISFLGSPFSCLRVGYHSWKGFLSSGRHEMNHNFPCPVMWIYQYDPGVIVCYMLVWAVLHWGKVAVLENSVTVKSEWELFSVVNRVKHSARHVASLQVCRQFSLTVIRN